MKNFFKLFGIIALVTVIGFSMSACDFGGGNDDSNDNGNGDNGGNGNGNSGGSTVTISGTTKLMMKLTATSGSNFSENYEWYYASRSDAILWSGLASYEEYFSGTNRSEFTIPVEDPNLLGQYIRARRRNHNSSSDVWSNVIGPVQLADSAAIVISGTSQLGMKLIAKSDPNFSGNYKWYFSSSTNPAVWTELEGRVRNSSYSGTNRREFIIPATDLNGTNFIGMYIMAKRLHNNIADIGSNVLGPIQPDNGGTVIINGTPKIGVKFTATSDSNFSGNYEWYYTSSADAIMWSGLSSYEAYHSGINRSEFTIPVANPNLLGQYIRAKRRNHMTNSDVWSNVIGPVQPAD